MRKLAKCTVGLALVHAFSAGAADSATSAEPQVQPSATWDYLVVSDSNKLNEYQADPADSCKRASLLDVLGHQGWELVQVVGFSSGAIDGSGTLTPRGNGRTEDLQFKAQLVQPHLAAIFKRPRPFHQGALTTCKAAQ